MSPKVIRGPVLAYGIQPRAERPTWEVGMAGLMDANQSLLEDIFDDIVALDSAREECACNRRGFPKESLVGINVPLLSLR